MNGAPQRDTVHREYHRDRTLWSWSMQRYGADQRLGAILGSRYKSLKGTVKDSAFTGHILV